MNDNENTNVHNIENIQFFFERKSYLSIIILRLVTDIIIF